MFSIFIREVVPISSDPLPGSIQCLFGLYKPLVLSTTKFLGGPAFLTLKGRNQGQKVEETCQVTNTVVEPEVELGSPDSQSGALS